nr:hypothetical protein BaRGS_028749 [Batillaria attramentaria]
MKQVDKFPRPKPRDRTEFSPEAMEKMVDSFDKNPYPGIDERVRLATLSGVEEGRIQACKKPTPQESYSRFSYLPHYHDDNRRQRPIFRAVIDSTGTEEKEPRAQKVELFFSPRRQGKPTSACNDTYNSDNTDDDNTYDDNTYDNNHHHTYDTVDIYDDNTYDNNHHHTYDTVDNTHETYNSANDTSDQTHNTSQTNNPRPALAF